MVVSDLYLAPGAAPALAGEMRLPGLDRMVRFGTLEQRPQGWRPWLAEWLGRHDLARASPGAIAACAPSVAAGFSVAAGPSGARAPAGPGRETQTPQWVWLADPLHLTASLTSLHLMPQGLLRLDGPTQAELCRAFDASFAGTGYALVPTRSGRFLATGPAPPGEMQTTDPARCLGSAIGDALPQGAAARALRRLGVEIEMWLHEHPINAHRMRTGRPPISTLWLWGGGAPLSAARGLSAVDERSPVAALLGDDPFVDGLSHLLGVPCGPVPYGAAARGLASLAAAADRGVVQIELFSPGGDSHPPDGSSAAPFHAPAAPAPLEALDRDWIEPALELLARREIACLAVVANDRQVSLTFRDRLKRWRRPRAVLTALRP
jgi:hypothetical protein